MPTGAHLSSLSVIDTRQADWPQRLGERIQWTLDGGLREARIELAPDGLGALDLHVQVSGDAVQLHIGAAHAATRELLSEALPRLRELLGDSGLSLGQASVSTSQERTPPRPPPSLWSPSGHGNGEEAASIAPVTRITRGLLDHYA